MTFLKKYAYSATGFNLLLGAMFVQFAMIMRGVFELEDGHINLSLETMIGADIAVATVLISMGALLGRTTAIQLLVMGFFEIALFAANEYFQLEYMKITDVGGSITVHAFGAYFGLAVSLMLRPSSKGEGESEKEAPSYNSDTFAMIGTIFLWIFWPSFNSVLVDGADQERAIFNTYLSLAAATGKISTDQISEQPPSQTPKRHPHTSPIITMINRSLPPPPSDHLHAVGSSEPRQQIGHGAHSELDAGRGSGCGIRLQFAHPTLWGCDDWRPRRSVVCLWLPVFVGE